MRQAGDGVGVVRQSLLIKEGTMARYVDGFLLAVPKTKLAAYRVIARKAGKVWRKHGALEYIESALDDTPQGVRFPFPKAARSKPGEVVIFSWIVYKSRAHRDAVNKKVMADPSVQAPPDMPFDMKRMAYGGFKALVDL
jgi:uncharacterized protein YbaA (DUF1428 family)